jgi:hypothetical protein
MPKINPSSKTIQDILLSNDKYVIPAYQRDFKWGETEAQDLIEDLQSAEGEDAEPLFLGTFIFSSSTNGNASVIDGQQRLTTILLLLIACRNRARDLGEKEIAYQTQRKITWMDEVTGESKGCRLEVSESIRDVFAHMADDKWDGSFPDRIDNKPVKRQRNKVKPIYDDFYSKVATYNRQQLTEFLRAIYECYVIVVAITSDEEALQIFERTNARGMELEISDLLKNHLFSKQVANISATWQEIQENAEGTILRLLKYFYVSKSGYVLKADLYRKLKDMSHEFGPSKLTNELRMFSEFYKLTKNPTLEETKNFFSDRGLMKISQNEPLCWGISHALQALREFGIAQFVPLAYAAIEMTERLGRDSTDSAKLLLEFLENLEKYHFVNNVVCERVGNDVERLYADTCVEFAVGGHPKDLYRAFFSELKKKIATEDEFVSRFAEISYPPPNRLSIVCYIFDRFVNYGLKGVQRVPIFIADKRALVRNHHIDHFLPQQLPAGHAVDQETQNKISNIGNLLPLYSKTNIQLSNTLPKEKAKRLKGDLKQQLQNYPFVSEFLQRYSSEIEAWDSMAIQTRATDLAKDGYRRIWHFG